VTAEAAGEGTFLQGLGSCSMARPRHGRDSACSQPACASIEVARKAPSRPWPSSSGGAMPARRREPLAGYEETSSARNAAGRPGPHRARAIWPGRD